MLKKILYINLTAQVSGAEFSLLSLMSGLDKNKFQPILLLPEPGPFLDRARSSGFEAIILPALIRFGEHFHFWKIPKALLAVTGLRRIIRAEGISLVHCNTPRAAYVGGLAARACGIPCVTHIRDIGQSPFERAWQSRWIGFLSDILISVSEATKGYVVALNPFLEKKICVLYNGIDTVATDRIPAVNIRGRWGIPASAPVIGAIGRIEPKKGFVVLIQAAEILKKTFPSLRVLIIGSVFEKKDQRYLNELSATIAAKRLLDQIIFTGFRADALGIMKALDVVVHPALCPDSLPRTVIEAAGLEKAIVASRVGGIPEILRGGVSGILVEPGNAQALADAICGLLANPEAAARLGETAKQQAVRDFSIERHVASITAIYESLWKERQ